jgi:hypothetical protein
VVAREGLSRLGCLVSVLLLAIIAFVGREAGGVYWNYYRYSDALEQEARYGASRTDDEIRRRLVALADSLGLPAEANLRLEVRRSGNRLTIETAYTDRIELPFYERDVRFRPRAEQRF